MMLTGFRWITADQLAGSGRPGLLNDPDEDIEFIVSQGIGTVVTLTMKPVPVLQRSRSFNTVHFPIPDMSFPTPRDAAQLCESIRVEMRRAPVLLHCKAGLGRTGMMAACCLVDAGEEPGTALRRVRAVNPNYVQTTSQERFIENFASYLRWLE